MLRLTRVADGYSAEVGPPDCPTAWSSERPLEREALRTQLEALGSHPVDVMDALAAADRRADNR